MPKAMRIALAVLIGFVVWFVVATFVNLPYSRIAHRLR